MNLSRLLRPVSLTLFAVLILLACSVHAGALTPYSYPTSQDYKASVYYKNLTALTPTGNARNDVLAVALSQLGYHEGDSDADFGGKNAAGSRNFVEYNRLAGKLDNNEGNGMSFGYAWCASFVNWCLRQAGVPKTVAGGEVSCSRWIRDFLKPSAVWMPSISAGGSYTPKPADLIFFRKSGSSSLSTHVGLVLYTDETYVYTVEGNTAENAVALDRYALTDPYIVGYGAPRYDEGAVPTVDYGTGGTVCGIYIVTADSLYVRAEPSTDGATVGGLKRSDTVTAVGFENGYARIEWAGGTAYTSRHYLTLVEADRTAALPDGTESSPLESGSPDAPESSENSTESPPPAPPSLADGAGCGAVLSPVLFLAILPLPVLLSKRKKRG